MKVSCKLILIYLLYFLNSRAEVAPGFEAIFISCPRLVQQIMRNEGSSPMKLIPEPWIIFNQLTNTKRGDDWHMIMISD